VSAHGNACPFEEDYMVKETKIKPIKRDIFQKVDEIYLPF
jgi:hypothetical protein